MKSRLVQLWYLIFLLWAPSLFAVDPPCETLYRVSGKNLLQGPSFSQVRVCPNFEVHIRYHFLSEVTKKISPAKKQRLIYLVDQINKKLQISKQNSQNRNSCQHPMEVEIGNFLTNVCESDNQFIAVLQLGDLTRALYFESQ